MLLSKKRQTTVGEASEAIIELLFRFQIKDDIKAARKKATKPTKIAL